MDDYINKLSSLEEKALAQVAINLCQEDGFKEVALCLEKPTYGFLLGNDVFINKEAVCDFVNDKEKFSEWAEVKGYYGWREDLIESFLAERGRRWDAAVEEQCRKLTEEIPPHLRQKIHCWMYHIALEYLTYSWRQEALFGISRYFLMNVFASGDWKDAARLNERKIAQRLLEDQRLTVLQRYRIACVYCLQVHIPQLWKRLTQEEKQFTSKGRSFVETNGLVLLWSQYMNAYRGEEVEWPNGRQWKEVLRQTLSHGNCAVLMSCWKELRKDRQQMMAVDFALLSLQKWDECDFNKEAILRSYFPTADTFQDYNLPSHYSELIHFFLLQMDQEQQLTFLKKAFQTNHSFQDSLYDECVLECFLDWPYQNDFLPLMNRLWGIMPDYRYGECLLALARKYSGNDPQSSRVCNYGYLLETLWEETPEEYKKYVFDGTNDGERLLFELLQRSPFQGKEELLFKRIFRDQPQERRRAMMLSKRGEDMCLLVMQRDRWSFVNWFLEECLPQEEIPRFKEQFIRLESVVQLCCDALTENREQLAENVIAWCLESDTEKSQYKDNLVNEDFCFRACSFCLRRGKVADVERMLNFCLSSEDKKERCKVRFAQSACDDLLGLCKYQIFLGDGIWEQMDAIIAWSVNTEEEIRDFKKNLFSSVRIDVHYELVFIKRQWEAVKRFYQWFSLSPEEIIKLKEDTLFSPRAIQCVRNAPVKAPVDSLRWCLTNETQVTDLRIKVEEVSFGGVEAKKQLDRLVSQLIDSFRVDVVPDEESTEGIFVKGTGEKRSSVAVEDESTSSRKRLK